MKAPCFFCSNTADKAASSHREGRGMELQLGTVPCTLCGDSPSCWTAPALLAAGRDVTRASPSSAARPVQRGQTRAPHPRATPPLALGRRAGRSREQWQVCPLPGRAGRGSAWGGTARCGCCNTRSSAAPPRRAATPRSWRWCCPPCCGRFRTPPPASCTPQGQLSLLLPEHLWRAKIETG